MALSLKWDSRYEARPPTGLNRNQLDNELRLMRDMTRQAMFQEHNFGPGTPDDGRHRAGRVTLYDVGGASNRDSLTDVPDGALYLLDKGGGSYELQGYHAATTSWVTIAYPDHSQLTNLLSSNAHPEFLRKDGGTLARPVNALSGGIHVPGAGVTKYGYTTSEHIEAGHPNQTRDIIENIDGGLSHKYLKKSRLVVECTDFYGYACGLNSCGTPGNKNEEGNSALVWVAGRTNDTTVISGSYSGDIYFVRVVDVSCDAAMVGYGDPTPVPYSPPHDITEYTHTDDTHKNAFSVIVRRPAVDNGDYALCFFGFSSIDYMEFPETAKVTITVDVYGKL